MQFSLWCIYYITSFKKKIYITEKNLRKEENKNPNSLIRYWNEKTWRNYRILELSSEFHFERNDSDNRLIWQFLTQEGPHRVFSFENENAR